MQIISSNLAYNYGFMHVCIYTHRKYFKTRGDFMISDDVSIDKFKVHKLSKKIQFDPFNCGVFSLKVDV